MLGQQETDLRTDAETDLAFALNATFLATVIALTLGIDRAVEQPHSLWFIAVCLGPALAAFAFYEIAVVAAVSWGNAVRAAIDLHRLDLYDKLGVRRPATSADDREVGIGINRMLLYGDVLPDAIRATPTAPEATANPADLAALGLGIKLGAGLVTFGVVAGKLLTSLRRDPH